MIENGIIKIKIVGGVTYGITHGDLRSVFGVAGNSMGAILQNATVNPWAKYKPTRCGDFHPADWWKGADDLCGFSIPQYDSAADLDGETDVWEYLKPRGNSVTPAEWYVRRDFDGYDHSAVIPFELKIPDYAFTTSATMVQILLGQNLASGNLAITDIGDFGDCYFGVAVFKDNNSPWFKTASAKLSIGTSAATKINIEDIPHLGSAGTVRIYLFLGKTQASGNGGTQQYDHDLWFLNIDGMPGYKTIEVYSQVENVYLYKILGFTTPADRKALVPVETYVSSGVFHADFVMSNQFDFTRIYELSSVSASAKLHSTGTVVQTQTISKNSCAPLSLEPGNNPGASVNFSAPLPGWTLPTPSAGDYYEITITFNYV